MSSDREPCETVRQHLFEYVDGAPLPRDVVPAVLRDHLARCPACARLEHEVRRLLARLLALGERTRSAEQASPALRQRVTDLLRRRDLPA